MPRISFYTGILTGTSQQDVVYPAGYFAASPQVFLTMEATPPNSGNFYGSLLSGQSNTGFSILFTDVVKPIDSGILINCYATN